MATGPTNPRPLQKCSVSPRLGTFSEISPVISRKFLGSFSDRSPKRAPAHFRHPFKKRALVLYVPISRLDAPRAVPTDGERPLSNPRSDRRDLASSSFHQT